MTAFLDAKPTVDWQRTSRLVRGKLDGVDVTCESRWWGHQWNVTCESEFPVPEKLILFVSERGMEHGYWRDLRVGDDAFDWQFFIFCDSPAILGIVLGPATRRALTGAQSIVLYVRDGRVKTIGLARAKDTDTLDRHLAIHRALATDHRAFLERWKEHIIEAQGRTDAVWPPTGTLLRPTGTLLVDLSWTAPTTRDASDWEDAGMSLRTQVTAHDDRPRLKWTLREVGPTTPRSHVLAGRPFQLVGQLGMSLATLEHIIGRADVTFVAVRDTRITVGLRGIASPRQIEGAIRIVHNVVEATVEFTSPYR